MDMFFPFPLHLSGFIFFPALLMIWVKKVPESVRAVQTSRAQAPVCLQRAFAVTRLLFILFEPWCHTWSPLCGPGQGLLASANQRQRGHRLLNSIMQGSASPPEVLWITSPVMRKLMKKMTHTTPCFGYLLSAQKGPQSGGGTIQLLRLLGKWFPSADKMGLGNQLLIFLSGLSLAVDFTVQETHSITQLNLRWWVEWTE